MAMESQAEALGQLTTDDLEGKVVIVCTPYNLSLYVCIIGCAWK